MSIKPGDRGGDCLRCGSETVMIGHDKAVYGTVCTHCNLLTLMDINDAMTVREAREEYETEDHDQEVAYQRYEGHTVGPDPNP